MKLNKKKEKVIMWVAIIALIVVALAVGYLYGTNKIAISTNKSNADTTVDTCVKSCTAAYKKCAGKAGNNTSANVGCATQRLDCNDGCYEGSQKHPPIQGVDN